MNCKPTIIGLKEVPKQRLSALSLQSMKAVHAIGRWITSATVCLCLVRKTDKDSLQHTQLSVRAATETMKHRYAADCRCRNSVGLRERDGLQVEASSLRSWIPDADWWAGYAEENSPEISRLRQLASDLGKPRSTNRWRQPIDARLKSSRLSREL